MKRMGYEIIASAICALLVLIAAIGEAYCDGSHLVSIFGAVKDIAASGVAFAVYFVAVKSLRENSRKNHDKLLYLDEFEKDKYEIFKAADISPYYITIFYGMQASIYSGDFKRILEKINEAINRKTLAKECDAVLRCVQDVLSLFDSTDCLQKALSDHKFDYYVNALSSDNEEWLECEKYIKDKDLLAWCRIQRADTLELVLENRVKFIYPANKEKYYEALDKCFEVIKLLNEQLAKNSGDKYYALLYRSYVNRNISLLYELLQDSENQKLYSYETLKNRKELFEHYEKTRAYSEHIEDQIAHEYLLSMVEHYSVEQDIGAKKELKENACKFYNDWTKKINLQKKIFKQVEDKMSEMCE